MRYVAIIIPGVVLGLICAMGLGSSTALADPPEEPARLTSDPPAELPLPSPCHELCRDHRRMCLGDCVTFAATAPDEPGYRDELAGCAMPCDTAAQACVEACP